MSVGEKSDNRQSMCSGRRSPHYDDTSGRTRLVGWGDDLPRGWSETSWTRSSRIVRCPSMARWLRALEVRDRGVRSSDSVGRRDQPISRVNRAARGELAAHGEVIVVLGGGMLPDGAPAERAGPRRVGADVARSHPNAAIICFRKSWCRPEAAAKRGGLDEPTSSWERGRRPRADLPRGPSRDTIGNAVYVADRISLDPAATDLSLTRRSTSNARSRRSGSSSDLIGNRGVASAAAPVTRTRKT